MTRKESGYQSEEVKLLQARVEELEKQAKALMVAERRASDAQLSLSKQLEMLRRANDLGKVLGAASSSNATST